MFRTLNISDNLDLQTWDLNSGLSAEGTTTAVLVPGRHKKTDERDWNQAENDAAEKGFDHREQPGQERATILSCSGPERGSNC